MRTFILFIDDYAGSSRYLYMEKRATLQELLDDFRIDYGEKESEEEALAYLDGYNGDGDQYYMIGEIAAKTFGGGFTLLLQ